MLYPTTLQKFENTKTNLLFKTSFTFLKVFYIFYVGAVSLSGATAAAGCCTGSLFPKNVKDLDVISPDIAHIVKDVIK